MLKRHKDLLRRVVTELRHLLAGYTSSDGTEQRGDLDRELERLGITPDGQVAPRDVLPNPTAVENWARRAAEAELASVPQNQRARIRGEVVERAAYSWINRLVALRALEARGLIDETLRGNPDYGGLSEALFVLRQDSPDRASGPDGGWWAVVNDACRSQAQSLPGLFALDDPAVALRPTTAALLRCVSVIGGAEPRGFSLDECDAAFADPDAIGWAYQFYQEEAKAQVYAGLKSGKKVGTRDEIAAATQLFTEPYMVKWLLQNSLGRSYHEAYPHSALPGTWEYYIRPERLDAPAFSTLESLTVLDPCMGSGHFLREAFDMLVAMYREQQPDLAAAEIADRVLARHLHGIDIDPRAAQLAAFTLYARAWELVRDERRARRQAGPGRYAPAALSLATTPDGIAPGALARHLQRHPGDRPLEPLLKGVFAALENADILGSLLRPREHLAAAIAELRRPRQLQMQPDPDFQTMQATIENILHTDPSRLEDMLLERVAASFASEAGDTDDVAAALFGRAAERGVRLLQLLDRHYAVAVTNPPYMGSKNMDTLLRQYVERHYPSGKRDLYATFILRCLELSHSSGRVAMVTMQGWMFLQSFAKLRALGDEKVAVVGKKEQFTGVLRETSIECLAHLGRYAFSDIGNAVVAPVMFTSKVIEPAPQHRMWACRLVAPRLSNEQAELIRVAVTSDALTLVSRPLQRPFLTIPQSPLAYWLRERFFELMAGPRLEELAYVFKGLDTSDNFRFVRWFWEVKQPVHRWFGYPKGGGYQKWVGKSQHCVDWEFDGARIKLLGRGTPRNEGHYSCSGLTYTEFGSGRLGVRILEDGEIFNTSSPGIIIRDRKAIAQVAGLLNSHISSFLLRSISASVTHLGEGYVALLPVCGSSHDSLNKTVELCITLKAVVTSLDPQEKHFDPSTLRPNRVDGSLPLATTIAEEAILHTAEGFVEDFVNRHLGLAEADVEQIALETGSPVADYPLLRGNDMVPSLADSIDFSLPQEMLESMLCHEGIDCDDRARERIKADLRALYQAGPGNEYSEQETVDEPVPGDDEDEPMTGSFIPLPPETFLEELSQKLQIHPISVYWLLQEIRAEGARCKPEEQRLLEDRLSVLVLRLLGHRWPKQIEAGEPVPAWADRDGIIPLLPGSGESPLAERLRERLRAEDGDLGAQQAEALLAELTARSLEEWLRRDFFPRHVRQFKYRPIAWHLASKLRTAGASGARGRGKGGARQAPAFECLVYYHASGVELLARLRTQYVEPLLHAERGRESAAHRASDETTAAQANARVQELEAFTDQLRGVEEHGFACAELEALVAQEPLDRWSGDGTLAPSGHDALLAQERAWTVDINDGVRVNIAPLQLAGVLATDVLKEPDARKASADRVRWRADERRWVREGVLPRCGWMAEDIPESPRWTERAPEREAERARLEAKRAEALRKLEGMEG